MKNLLSAVETSIKELAKPYNPDVTGTAIALHREQALGFISGAYIQWERARVLLELIAKSYSDDPGTSDLYDEQPVTLSITLGEVRAARRLLRESRQ